MDIIEKVARALCIDHGGNPDGDFYHGMSDTVGKNWEYYDSMARIAIEAMREPTQPMKATGVNVLIDLNLDGPDGVGLYEVEALWDSMIDEALNEHTPEGKDVA